MDQFIFNKYGVCENPIRKSFKCVKGYEAVVNVAIIQKKKWSYSISFTGKNQGWSQPLIFHAVHNAYETQKEAYLEGVNLLLRQIEHNNDFKNYDGVIKILRNELEPIREYQLTLF